MSPAEYEAVVRRFWTEVLDPHGGYLEGIDEVWSDDLVWHGPAGLGTVRGKQEYKKTFNLFLGAFPDAKVTPEAILVDDNENLVTTRYSWRGTHTGEFLGIPPTGKPVTVTGISIYRVENDKIAEEWFQQDMLGLLQQIGAAPMPGGGGGS
jgi:steroid delta-isomerase-like uncharacterized protein